MKLHPGEAAMAQTPKDEEFSRRLNRIITEQGIKQIELAHASGLHNSQINALKKGDEPKRISKTPVLKCIKGLIIFRVITTVDEIKSWLHSYSIERRANQLPVKQLSFQERRELVQLVKHVQEQIRAEREQALEKPKYTTTQGIPFIGRDDDISKVIDLLRAEFQFITITGIGGVGKSELARIVAEEAEQQRLFRFTKIIELDAVENAEEVFQRLTIVHNGISTMRQILVILDNCEHIHNLTKQVDRFLTTHKNTYILATSRDIMSDINYSLECLNVPETPLEPLNQLCKNNAIQLFLARVNLNKSETELLRLTDENRHLIVSICSLFGGLPLALLMAASWVDELKLEGIIWRIHQGTIQEHEYIIGDERHKNLQTLVAVCYDQLREQGRKLFTRLSLFVDWCSVDAARKICSVDEDLPTDETAFINLIRVLKKHHLVTFTNMRVKISHSILESFAFNKLKKVPQQEENKQIHNHNTQLILQYMDYYNELVTGYMATKYYEKDEPKAVASYPVFSEYKNIILAYDHILTFRYACYLLSYLDSQGGNNLIVPSEYEINAEWYDMSNEEKIEYIIRRKYLEEESYFEHRLRTVLKNIEEYELTEEEQALFERATWPNDPETNIPYPSVALWTIFFFNETQFKVELEQMLGKGTNARAYYSARLFNPTLPYRKMITTWYEVSDEYITITIAFV